jgi:hypothetical protein
MLEKEIDAYTLYVASLIQGSDEYDRALSHLEKLYKIKQGEKSKKISPDTKAIIIANLAGIGLILAYEHAHVITSKALSFVTRGRV